MFCDFLLAVDPSYSKGGGDMLGLGVEPSMELEIDAEGYVGQ